MGGSKKRRILENYFTLQRGTTYKSQLLGQPGPVLLGLATIKRNGGFRSDSLKTYGGVSPEKLLVRPGELYLSLKDVTQSADLLGAVARLPPNHPPGRLTQDTVKLQPRQEDVPLDYLYWLLQTPQYREYCRGRATGTTNLGLAREDFLAFPAPEPTLAQDTIVAVLNSLEAKVELNRRTNETLEAMARALFKSWFVDFDPVRAKAEGRVPVGMDAETAKLFSSEFVESELGPIPKGWRSTTLGVAIQTHGGVIQTGPFGSQLHASDYVEAGIPVVMPKDIVGRYVSSQNIARVSEQDATRLSRHRLEAGDLVYSRRGDVEKHALAGGRESGWLCGTGCLLVRLGKTWPSTMFASLAMDHPDTRAWVFQHAIGATMPNLNTGILGAVPLVMPTDQVMRTFQAVVAPLQTQIVACHREAITLTELRDALLPRLLSGELSVTAAQEQIGRAHV